MNKKYSKQPLSYQQQDSSCWITSVMNGLLYVLESANKIPNEVPRILYALSSKDGTEKEEAKKTVDFLNSHNIKVKLDIFSGNDVTPDRMKTLLGIGVVIADVSQGSHSVLITGFDEGRFKIFDPDWGTIKKGLRKTEKFINYIDDKRDYNILVDEEELFKKHANGKIRLGGENSRYIIGVKSVTVRAIHVPPQPITHSF